MDKVDKYLSTYFDEVEMRKNKRRLKYLRSQKYKNREIRISNSAIDHYRTVYPNRNSLDLMVDLYDAMMKIVIHCENRFITNEMFSDTSSFEEKVRLPNIDKQFEISVWTERDYSDSQIKTVIFVNLKSSSISLTTVQVENELTERFLRGAK